MQNPYRIQPVLVQILTLRPRHVDHPSAATLIALVFPHRTDVLLEQRVIASDLDIGRALNVIVQTPKVLHGGKAGHLIEGIFPRFAAIRFLVPEGPSGLQRVLD